MENFQVTWSVEYYDEDVVYTTSDQFQAEDLDDLFEILDNGIQEGFLCPENEVPYHDGDFNIEYVLIHDDQGVELYRDEDFDESRVANA